MPFEALARPRETGGVTEMCADFQENRSKGARGYRDEHVPGAGQRLRQIRDRLQALWKRRFRQIALVAPRALHGLEQRRVAAPEAGWMAGSRALNGERGSPGAGADHGHRG
jgi:hypothetical protein